MKYFPVVLVTILFAYNSAIAQPKEIYNAADLEIALQKLNVLGSVLYVGAHPDDENTGVLAYFSKGRKYRSAYLSLTRGDGGQNLVGSEKGDEIGMLRTQELLEARRIDGGEQFFTHAIDFGFSKSAEETFEFWGRDLILSDIVWVIRNFRPDIIITRFPTGSGGGHGHHTASGILAREAFQAAGNPNKFPEQLKYVQPWQTKRLFWNSFRPSPQQAAGALRVDIGEYNALLGKSYSEIAAESRSMHKSQGFGSAPRRGNRDEYFTLVDGDPAKTDVFDEIDATWNRIPGGQKIGEILGEVLKSFDPSNPDKAIPELLKINKALNGLQKNYWIDVKRRELSRIIQSCAGIWMEAIADDFSIAPGDRIRIHTVVMNRSSLPFKIEKMRFPQITPDSVLNLQLKNNEPAEIDETVGVPENYPVSQPYWLKDKHTIGAFSIPDQRLVGLAENPPSMSAEIALSIEDNKLEYSIPVLYRWTDRVNGELYRPLQIRPQVTLNLKDKVCIFPDDKPKEIKLVLQSNSRNVSGEIRLRGSEKWKVEPSAIPFSMANKYEEKQVSFKVFSPNTFDESVFVAEAEVTGKKYNRALIEISHPHITTQVYFPESDVKLVRLDVKLLRENIGYVVGAGDDVADCLQNLGYNVTFLDEEALDNKDLSSFDAIVTGIRTYNTREWIKNDYQKLMDYVKNGGTLLVQYNVASDLKTREIGPYPFTLGQDRVCVETAPVTFLNPNHQLMNFPNKITQKDFEGWIQERGLYFATQWDEKYETVFASHDPNEPDRKGGTLFCRYGKGVFIYTGYAWFRQLPAGVPGAYRLFVNLISAGKYNGK